MLAIWASTREQISQTAEAIAAIDSELQGKDFGIEYVQGLQVRLCEVCDNIIERGAEASAFGLQVSVVPTFTRSSS